MSRIVSTHIGTVDALSAAAHCLRAVAGLVYTMLLHTPSRSVALLLIFHCIMTWPVTDSRKPPPQDMATLAVTNLISSDPSEWNVIDSSGSLSLTKHPLFEAKKVMRMNDSNAAHLVAGRKSRGSGRQDTAVLQIRGSTPYKQMKNPASFNIEHKKSYTDATDIQHTVSSATSLSGLRLMHPTAAYLEVSFGHLSYTSVLKITITMFCTDLSNRSGAHVAHASTDHAPEQRSIVLKALYGFHSEPEEVASVKNIFFGSSLPSMPLVRYTARTNLTTPVLITSISVSISLTTVHMGAFVIRDPVLLLLPLNRPNTALDLPPGYTRVSRNVLLEGLPKSFMDALQKPKTLGSGCTLQQLPDKWVVMSNQKPIEFTGYISFCRVGARHVIHPIDDVSRIQETVHRIAHHYMQLWSYVPGVLPLFSPQSLVIEQIPPQLPSEYCLIEFRFLTLHLCIKCRLSVYIMFYQDTHTTHVHRLDIHPIDTEVVGTLWERVVSGSDLEPNDILSALEPRWHSHLMRVPHDLTLIEMQFAFRGREAHGIVIMDADMGYYCAVESSLLINASEKRVVSALRNNDGAGSRMHISSYHPAPRWMSLDALLNGGGLRYATEQPDYYNPYHIRTQDVCSHASPQWYGTNILYTTDPSFNNKATGEQEVWKLRLKPSALLVPGLLYTHEIEVSFHVSIGDVTQLETLTLCFCVISSGIDIVKRTNTLTGNDFLPPRSHESSEDPHPIAVHDAHIAMTTLLKAPLSTEDAINVSMKVGFREDSANTFRLSALCIVQRLFDASYKKTSALRSIHYTPLSIQRTIYNSLSLTEYILDTDTSSSSSSSSSPWSPMELEEEVSAFSFPLSQTSCSESSCSAQSALTTLPQYVLLARSLSDDHHFSKNRNEEQMWRTDVSRSLQIQVIGELINTDNAFLKSIVLLWVMYSVMTWTHDGRLSSRNIWFEEYFDPVSRPLKRTIALPLETTHISLQIEYSRPPVARNVTLSFRAVLILVEGVGTPSRMRVLSSMGPDHPEERESLYERVPLLMNFTSAFSELHANHQERYMAKPPPQRRVERVTLSYQRINTPCDYAAVLVLFTPLYHALIVLAALVCDFSYGMPRTQFQRDHEETTLSVLHRAPSWILSPLDAVLSPKHDHNKGSPRSSGPFILQPHYWALVLLCILGSGLFLYSQWFASLLRSIWGIVSTNAPSATTPMLSSWNMLTPSYINDPRHDHTSVDQKPCNAYTALLSFLGSCTLYTYTCVTYTAYRALVRCYDMSAVDTSEWAGGPGARPNIQCGYGVLVPCFSVVCVSWCVLLVAPLLVRRWLRDHARCVEWRCFAEGGRGMWPSQPHAHRVALPRRLMHALQHRTGTWVHVCRAEQATTMHVPFAVLLDESSAPLPMDAEHTTIAHPDPPHVVWLWFVDHQRTWCIAGTTVLLTYLHALCFLLSLGVDVTIMGDATRSVTPRRVGCGMAAAILTLGMMGWYVMGAPLRYTALNRTRAAVYALLAIHILVATFRPVTVSAEQKTLWDRTADSVGIAVIALSLLDGVLHSVLHAL